MAGTECPLVPVPVTTGRELTASFDTVDGMIDSYPDAPPRLAPFLAQWDYVIEQLFSRLDGLSDEELLWEPAPGSWTVRRADDGPTQPTSGDGWWAAAADPEPPRTLAWSMSHLGAGRSRPPAPAGGHRVVGQQGTALA